MPATLLQILTLASVQGKIYFTLQEDGATGCIGHNEEIRDSVFALLAN